jgi:hypothetical protein
MEYRVNCNRSIVGIKELQGFMYLNYVYKLQYT